MLKTVTVKVEDRLLAELEAEASARGVSRSDVVRERLERPRSAKGRIEGSLWDRMKDLVIHDPRAPADLSSNKDHMDGYGESRTPRRRAARRRTARS